MALKPFTADLAVSAREWDGDRLRELRKARGLRLADLAQFATVSRQRLGQIEASLHPSDRDLAHYFDAVNASDLADAEAGPLNEDRS